MPTAEDVLVTLLFASLTGVGGPLPTAMGTCLDSRIRKESFDLEWLCRNLGAPESAPPPL